MRKSLALFYLLATIVLFASTGSNPTRRGWPNPPCFPCTDASLAPR